MGSKGAGSTPSTGELADYGIELLNERRPIAGEIRSAELGVLRNGSNADVTMLNTLGANAQTQAVQRSLALSNQLGPDANSPLGNSLLRQAWDNVPRAERNARTAGAMPFLQSAFSTSQMNASQPIGALNASSELESRLLQANASSSAGLGEGIGALLGGLASIAGRTKMGNSSNMTSDVGFLPKTSSPSLSGPWA